MVTSSPDSIAGLPALPFGLIDAVADRLGSTLRPPAWAVHEAQQRLVLLLNHILQQEPAALERLRRQAGRVAQLGWRDISLRLAVTPAGLLELADAQVPNDLSLTLADVAPSALLQAALRGDKPAVRIEGDVQLAAEVNWLIDHVRWDIEEDLARLLGDAPAHGLSSAARRLALGLRERLRRTLQAEPTPGA
ncbi:MAG: hypothetical protein RLZ58_1812 [Pseudomonadota bacterium]|jgi:ubiquinone biosynthesis protein UbiJ